MTDLKWFLDKRHQPPVPLNTSLLDLLEIVKNAKNPWLLFLLVGKSGFLYLRITYYTSQKSTLSFQSKSPGRSYRECITIHC